MTTAPVARERRRDRRRSGGIVSFAVCLLVVAAIGLVTPDPSRDYRYHYVDVSLGEWSRLREFDVRATGVDVTSSVSVFDEPVSTGYAYVVVQVEAAAKTRAQYFTTVELRTRDARTYDARPDWSSAQPQIVQPGFSTRGVWVFELPVDRVAGARLVVGPTPGEVTRYDNAARIDLGLASDATVAPGPVALGDGMIWVTR